MQDLADIQHSVLKCKRKSPVLRLTRKRWWIFVGFNIASVIVGQTAATQLGRFYYLEGGSGMFLASLVKTAGFPILCIPLILIPLPASSSPPSISCTKKRTAMIYLSLGVLLSVSDLLYGMGFMYLSPSTYFLICATQLAFNSVFAYFLNSQKFTPLILNSVVILTFAAALFALNLESDPQPGASKLEYAIGFLCTVGASAVYSLLLSLVQLSFQKVFKTESFGIVMRMQIYTSLVATVVSLGGLFVSGQWRILQDEMVNFKTGPASYLMTLVWSAISWQVGSVGVVGLIYLASSLFSNAISTATLAVGPVASLIVFHQSINGVVAIAMLMSLWGFGSYLFQTCLDDRRRDESEKQAESDSSITEIPLESSGVISIPQV